MAACIPTYMLASSLIGGGMNWSQAILTIFLANVIVLIPMVLNAHAGTRYGIPFPVYCRAAFGTSGANVPALLRALVACGWFGIQAWIGGQRDLQDLRDLFFRPSLQRRPSGGWASTRRTPVLLRLLGDQHVGDLQGHRLHSAALEHQGAAAHRARVAPPLVGMRSRGRLWSHPRAASRPSMRGNPKPGSIPWAFFVPALTGMIGFWARSR
jgi:NCS1 family nucleobase:cation symporter-1